jgi:hypothetical protein
MKSLLHIIPITAISLVSFVGCKDFHKNTTAETPAIIKTSDTKIESENKISKTPESKKDDFSPLMSVVSGTKTAVTGKKFDQAENEFDKFETAWSKVEDSVRAKSATSYREIEDAATEVKNAIKAKNQEKVLKGLQTIDKNISNISQSKK